jgi:hypothetical protein
MQILAPRQLLVPLPTANRARSDSLWSAGGVAPNVMIPFMVVGSVLHFLHIRLKDIIWLGVLVLVALVWGISALLRRRG